MGWERVRKEGLAKEGVRSAAKGDEGGHRVPLKGLVGTCIGLAFNRVLTNAARGASRLTAAVVSPSGEAVRKFQHCKNTYLIESCAVGAMGWTPVLAHVPYDSRTRCLLAGGPCWPTVGCARGDDGGRRQGAGGAHRGACAAEAGRGEACVWGRDKRAAGTLNPVFCSSCCHSLEVVTRKGTCCTRRCNASIPVPDVTSCALLQCIPGTFPMLVLRRCIWLWTRCCPPAGCWR